MALRICSKLFPQTLSRTRLVAVSSTYSSKANYSSQYYPIDENLFALTEEQQELREAAFNFALKELAPFAQDIDKNNGWSDLREFWKIMGNMGFLGPTAKQEYGGLGGTYTDHCIIMEEISRAISRQFSSVSGNN